MYDAVDMRKYTYVCRQDELHVPLIRSNSKEQLQVVTSSRFRPIN